VSAPLAVALPDELLETIAERAADILAERTGTVDSWLTVAEAAEHLRCPKSRVYSLASTRPARIPVHRDGSRLLFRRSELDAWVVGGGGKRP